MDAHAFGLELGANIPTAKSALGSGKADYKLNGIYSQHIRRLHLDINLNATRIGAPEQGSSRVETGLAAALSNEFNKNWTGVVEWSGTRRSGTQSTAQLLAGVARRPDKEVFDRRWLRQGAEQGDAGLVVLYRVRVSYR